MKRLEGDEDAAGGQNHSDHQSADGFQAAVAVGMFGIRWFGGDHQAEQHQAGSQHIAG